MAMMMVLESEIMLVHLMEKKMGQMLADLMVLTLEQLMDCMKEQESAL